MNILLVRPPYKRLMGVRQPPYFSLGIGYLGSYLEKAGYRVHLYNAENQSMSRLDLLPDERDIFRVRGESQANYFSSLEEARHPVWEEYERILRDVSPDVVGISVLSNEVGSAVKMSRLTKAWKKNCAVVWGGVHPTFLPEESLRYGCVDYVVRGEGEQTMLELCRFLETGTPEAAAISGISYPDGSGRMHHTPDRPLLRDLDSLPIPRRQLSVLSSHLNAMDTENLIASRGCPYRCTFCSSRLFWNKTVRMRSPQNIVDEIVFLKADSGLRHFIFLDDSFTLLRENIENMCRALIRGKTRIFWSTMTRADLLDDALIGLMKRSGCIELNLGIETGSERVSRMISKDLKKDHVLHTVRSIKKAGISCGTFFILGFPEETLEDLHESFLFMKALEPTRIGLNIFEPQPGSDLYRRAIDLGLIDPRKDWARQAFWPREHFMKHVPAEQFSRAVREIASWVFDYNARTGTKLKKYRTHLGRRFWSDPRYFFYRGLRYARKRLQRRR